MAGAIRCRLVRVERLERQLADASEGSKGEQAPQTPLGRISRCAVSVVDTLVSLDRPLQEGVVERLEPVRLEPQEIVLPIKEETVDAVTLIPRERVQQRTAEQIGDVPQLLEETVEVVNATLQERISERSEAIKVPKISRQGSASFTRSQSRVWTRGLLESQRRVPRHCSILWWSWAFLAQSKEHTQCRHHTSRKLC